MRCMMAVIGGGGFGSRLRQCLYAPDTVECFLLELPFRIVHWIYFHMSFSAISNIDKSLIS